jgi:PAS domain S-box-containing protein
MKAHGYLDQVCNLLVKDGKRNWRAIAAIYMIVLLPILLLAGYSSFKTHRDLTSQVHSQKLGAASLAATTLKEKLDRLVDLGVSLASRVRFRQLISDRKWSDANDILRSVPRDFPFIDRFFLADLDGTLMADFPTVAEVRGMNFAERDWYRGVSRDWKPYISEVYRRAAKPQYNVVAAALPIKSDDGKLAAILILQLKLESLLEWIKDVDAGAHGAFLIVDRGGKLAARPPIDPQDKIRDFSRHSAVRKAIQGQQGVETLPNSRGEDELFAYHPVAGYGWAVALQQPAHAAYASRDHSLRLSFITYGLIILLSCALAYLILSVLIRAKEAEEARSQMAAIVEFSDDAILSKTLDGTIATWNKGATTIYGYDAAEVVGRSVNLLIPKEKSGDLDDILARVQRGETVNHYETTRLKKNSDTIEVSLTVSPIKNAAGKIVGASTIARDITRRKRLEREIQEKTQLMKEQYRLVQEANRLKSEFLANMSHELRTPLNAIIGFAQLMHDGKVGPVSTDHKEYLGDILNSGRRLLELINDVLDLARIESGKMEFCPESVKLSSLVEQACLILKSPTTNKRLKIETELSPEVEDLFIDPAKLKQVLYNYLSNAIKFTPDGGVISIRALSEDNDRLRLEVRDTGLGIARDRIGELFLEFKQLEAGLSKKHQGTGLGLALTKKIVEAQGGQVGVLSTVGEGSSFYAILPKIAPPVREKPAERAPVAIVAPRGPKLLVVEDDEYDFNCIKKILSESGYTVDGARSGAEGVAKAQAAPYDAILLDLILPDRLGWDVLNAIRNAEPNRNAPVIVLTVVAEKEAAKSFALQDYLLKPVSAGELLSALRRAGVIAHGGGKKVLVVDDDPAVLKLAGAALESSGYQALCHSSAASALCAAAKSELDAIVVDLLMPEIDGFEFLDRVRNLANCRNTPVIVWTAKPITTEERERLNNGASSIALKGQGGIDAVLRELRYHVDQRAEAAAPEIS